MLQTVTAGDLEIAYYETGPADGPVVILLHGFPYDPRSYDAVAQILSDQGIRCLVPYLRGYGPTRFLGAATMRSGQQAALAYDLKAFMDALGVTSSYLAGYDWGGRAACIVSAIWPERVRGLLSCGMGYNIQDIPNAWQPAPASEEARYWYIYFFNTRRGRTALERDRNDICAHIWKLWSPTWGFDAATFSRTAKSFENPDFVEVVIHSYRHRLGDTPGDPRFDALETRLAAQPGIGVPSIVLQGATDGVDPPQKEDAAAPHFTGYYERRVLETVGHNPPQEAPVAFAAAVKTLAAL